jgi:hypothetical protein
MLASAWRLDGDPNWSCCRFAWNKDMAALDTRIGGLVDFLSLI